MNLFERGLKTLELESKKWSIGDPRIGIVTAGDKNVFRGIQSLFASIKNKINFLCYDLGLTSEQIKWCTNNNLPLKPMSSLSEFLKIQTKLIKIDKGWFSYAKPWVIQDSPFEYTVWVDTDCVVVGDLTQADLIINKRTFFVEHFCTACDTNKPYLYECLPVKANLTTCPIVNAGVFGIHKKDVQDLVVNKWQYLIDLCIQNSKLKKTCDFYWDEGMLNWSLQKDNSIELITNCFLYNWPGNITLQEKLLKDKANKIPSIFAPINFGPSLFFLNLLKNSTDKYIVHFASGETNIPKYFNCFSSTDA